MKQQAVGKLLSVALLLGSACATTETTPPPIPVFFHDGLGGADGRESNGDKAYKKPSQLKNWWMTDPLSMARFSAWCYRLPPNEVDRLLAEILEQQGASK